MTKDEWDPFEELVQLRKRFSELFERSFLGRLNEEHNPSGRWFPPLDVYRDENQVVVHIEIPGVDKDAVDIELTGNRLIIRGNRAPARGNGRPIFHRIERQHGPFERILKLSDPIDADRIQAEYNAGVLTVVLPLRRETNRRTIKLGST